MKRICLAALTLVVLCGCTLWIKGSGQVVREDIEVAASASAVSVSSALRLVLDGNLEAGEVVIYADDNMQQYIVAKSSESKVKFSLEGGRSYRNYDIEIRVSDAQFNSVSASGSSKVVRVGETEFDSYSVWLSGSSEYEGTLYISSELKLHLSGSSNADIQGASPSCKISCSGSSDVDAEEFTADELKISLSGSSEAEVTVNKSIRGSLSGSSKLRHGGTATDIDISTSGSSKVIEVL